MTSRIRTGTVLRPAGHDGVHVGVELVQVLDGRSTAHATADREVEDHGIVRQAAMLGLRVLLDGRLTVLSATHLVAQVFEHGP